MRNSNNKDREHDENYQRTASTTPVIIIFWGQAQRFAPVILITPIRIPAHAVPPFSAFV